MKLKFSKPFIVLLFLMVAAAYSAATAFSGDTFSYGQINTVKGPICPEELGVTLPHEHIASQFPGWRADDTIAPYDRDAIKHAAQEMLNSLKAVGIQTFVDATPNDLGPRDPQLLKELANSSGVNLICATGLYYEHGGASYYWTFRQGVMKWYPWYSLEDEIYELFMREITEGIGKTKIKAGVIKVGTSYGEITDYENVVFRAAARAQMQTGLPIITHTEGPTMGPEQADLLISLGVNPERIMIGHMNNSWDIDYHRSILLKDVFISFDRTGLGFSWMTEIVLDIIAQLAAEGYADQIMLSHDYSAAWPGRPIDWGAIAAYIEDWHPTFISEEVIPRLIAKGVTEAQINMMMVENPKRLFLGDSSCHE